MKVVDNEMKQIIKYKWSREIGNSNNGVREQTTRDAAAAVIPDFVIISH